MESKKTKKAMPKALKAELHKALESYTNSLQVARQRSFTVPERLSEIPDDLKKVKSKSDVKRLIKYLKLIVGEINALGDSGIVATPFSRTPVQSNVIPSGMPGITYAPNFVPFQPLTYLPIPIMAPQLPIGLTIDNTSMLEDQFLTLLLTTDTKDNFKLLVAAIKSQSEAINIYDLAMEIVKNSTPDMQKEIYKVNKISKDEQNPRYVLAAKWRQDRLFDLPLTNQAVNYVATARDLVRIATRSANYAMQLENNPALQASLVEIDQATRILGGYKNLEISQQGDMELDDMMDELHKLKNKVRNAIESLPPDESLDPKDWTDQQKAIQADKDKKEQEAKDFRAPIDYLYKAKTDYDAAVVTFDLSKMSNDATLLKSYLFQIHAHRMAIRTDITVSSNQADKTQMEIWHSHLDLFEAILEDKILLYDVPDVPNLPDVGGVIPVVDSDPPTGVSAADSDVVKLAKDQYNSIQGLSEITTEINQGPIAENIAQVKIHIQNMRELYKQASTPEDKVIIFDLTQKGSTLMYEMEEKINNQDFVSLAKAEFSQAQASWIAMQKPDIAHDQMKSLFFSISNNKDEIMRLKLKALSIPEKTKIQASLRETSKIFDKAEELLKDTFYEAGGGDTEVLNIENEDRRDKILEMFKEVRATYESAQTKNDPDLLLSYMKDILKKSMDMKALYAELPADDRSREKGYIDTTIENVRELGKKIEDINNAQGSPPETPPTEVPGNISTGEKPLIEQPGVSPDVTGSDPTIPNLPPFGDTFGTSDGGDVKDNPPVLPPSQPVVPPSQPVVPPSQTKTDIVPADFGERPKAIIERLRVLNQYLSSVVPTNRSQIGRMEVEKDIRSNIDMLQSQTVYTYTEMFNGLSVKNIMDIANSSYPSAQAFRLVNQGYKLSSYDTLRMREVSKAQGYPNAASRFSLFLNEREVKGVSADNKGFTVFFNDKGEIYAGQDLNNKSSTQFSVDPQRLSLLRNWKNSLYDTGRTGTLAVATVLKDQIEQAINGSIEMTLLDLTNPRGNFPGAYATIIGVNTEKRNAVRNIQMRPDDMIAYGDNAGQAFHLEINSMIIGNPNPLMFNQYGETYVNDDNRGSYHPTLTYPFR